jgi:hypothetical protein
MRLDCHLTSYPNCDEFQVGSLLVFVTYTAEQSRTWQIHEAERRLIDLEPEVPNVEALVTTYTGSTVPSEVISIRIYPDGTASYDCTFFDGEYEDKFFYVSRSTMGELQIET